MQSLPSRLKNFQMNYKVVGVKTGKNGNQKYLQQMIIGIYSEERLLRSITISIISKKNAWALDSYDRI
jgi:hypothetical protein